MAAIVAPRTGQKKGAWTRKKLRKQRLDRERARGFFRDEKRRDPVQRAFPKQL